MKPIKIVIEGVNSFTDAQTLDFEAVGRTNLFCISGKTGAGKTTIFDSIMLALYGNCGRGNLADIINLSLKKARVVLEFTEGADNYIVDRTFTRKTSDPKDANCTSCMLTKNGAPFATGRGDTDKIIRDIIGLGEKEFKNVYLLEQGEYADFLKKTANEQTAAVGKIFSLMRFDDVCKRARDRKKAEDAEADAQSKLVEAYGDVTADSLRDEKTALATLKSQTTALRKKEEAGRAELIELNKKRDLYNEARTKQENVKRLAAQADEARAKLNSADLVLDEFEAAQDKTLASRLAALRERRDILVALNARDRECAAAEKDAADKNNKAGAHKAELDGADKRTAELAEQKTQEEKKFGEIIKKFNEHATTGETSDVLKRAADTVTINADVLALSTVERDISDELNKYSELCKLAEQKAVELARDTEDCDKRLNIIERFSAELKNLNEDRSVAQGVRDGALAALENARLHSYAQSVRAELHDGDTCPVCGGVYNGGVECGDTDVDKRKAEFDKAEAALAAVAKKLDECGKALDRAKTEYNHAEEKRKACDTEHAELVQRAQAMYVDTALYGELIATLKNAQIFRRRLTAAAENCEKHAAEYSLIAERLAAAQAAAVEAADKAAALRSELGDNYGKTGGLLAAADSELAGLTKTIDEAEARRKALTLEVSKAKGAADAATDTLERARADCPVDLPSFDEDIYNERTAQNEQLLKQIAENDVEIGRREVEINMHERSLASIGKAAAERDAHIKRSKLYGEIVELTKSKAMLNFVAAEYIEDFTAAASDILSELSGGKYTMDYDKENGFFVSDYLNDGKLRKTDTLSGGELFLASLSVAIAIARTQAGGNNAFFFLDEGFGTLDDDLIDTVYAALESLSRDCLVGVISHSSELIEKMPSCVEVVEATDTAGSRIKY